MSPRSLWVIGHGGLLLVVLFGVAVISGYWAIPLAFAPAAYHLVFAANHSSNAPKHVVVSHLLALLVGWGTYLVIAPDIPPTDVEPFSSPALRLVVSLLVAFGIVTGLFRVLDLRHWMAYVTGFVAALGALPTLWALTVAALTVLVVAGIQALRREIGPQTSTQPVV